MARRQIIFVIVEGPSDQDALELLLSKIFDKSKIYVHVIHGDITTRTGNIKIHVANEIRAYAENNHFAKTDFRDIIHIVDTDGAFINDEHIVESADVDKVVYTTEKIIAPSKENIIARNEIKASNLNVLSAISTVWGGVPYSIYYMSCNLDHVLYNKINSTPLEKERDSFQFAKKYKQDIRGFIDLITKSDFSAIGSYVQTWELIKKDKNSLNRHTNLGLCFPTES